MTHAFYPGSFDPFTNGHLDVLLKACKLFDKVTVGVFQNPLKESSFLDLPVRAKLVYDSYKEKMPLTVETISDLSFNVMMCGKDTSSIDVCNQIGATVMIRGLRSVTDYEYELQLAMANKLIDPNVETVFVVPDIENQFVSSTIARELFRLKKFDQLKKIVPTDVYDYIKLLNFLSKAEKVEGR